MKKPKLSGKAWILWLAAGAFLLSAVLFTQAPQFKEAPPPDAPSPKEYGFVSYQPFPERPFLNLLIPDYVEDEQIQNAIKASLSEALSWAPKHWGDEDFNCSAFVPYMSDRFFSVTLFVTTHTELRHISFYICHTLDLQTGQILYLDDLVDTDELLKRLMVSGFVRWDPRYADRYEIVPQEFLDRNSEDEVREGLALCSVPYTAREYGYAPAFYLEEGRLCFVDVCWPMGWPNHDEFYILLDDIRGILKVDLD